MLVSSKMQAHLSAPNVEQLIDLLISIPVEGHDNSFVYLMSEWTKQQGNGHVIVIVFFESVIGHVFTVYEVGSFQLNIN